MRQLGRSLGIVAVFTVLGPVVVAAALLLVAVVIGLPLFAFLLLVFEFATMWNWLSTVLFVAGLAIAAGTALPAFVTGIAFAIAAVYFSANSLPVAIVIAMLAAILVVALGLLLGPTESRTLWLPQVDGVGQFLWALT